MESPWNQDGAKLSEKFETETLRVLSKRWPDTGSGIEGLGASEPKF